MTELAGDERLGGLRKRTGLVLVKEGVAAILEQRLVKALGWLKRETTTLPGKLRTVLGALTADLPANREALQRMDLHQPSSIGEKLNARLVAHALQQGKSLG